MTIRRWAASLALALIVQMLFGFSFGSGAAAADTSQQAPGTYVPVTPTRVLDTRGTVDPLPAVGANAAITASVLAAVGVQPAQIAAVALTVTATQPSRAGYFTVYPNGTTRPNASTLNFVAGQTVANFVTVATGSDGRVAVFNGSLGSTHVLVDVSGYYLAGAPTDPGAFVARSQSRLLDTRLGGGATNGVAAGSSISIQASGRAGLPASGAGSVVVNLTVTQPAASGYLTAYAGGTAQPGTSAINFAAGQTVANMAVIPVGADGTIRVFNGSAGPMQLIVDVAGYFISGTSARAGGYTAIAPVREADTRSSGAVKANQDYPVFADSSLSAADATALVMTVTVTEPQSSGFLSIHSSRIAPDLGISQMNFSANQTVATTVVVALRGASSPSLGIFNGSRGTVQVIIDVVGWIRADAATSLTWARPSTIDAQSGELVATSCFAGPTCLAFSDDGSVFRLSTGTWTKLPVSLPGMTVRSVSCSSSTLCMGLAAPSGTPNYAAYRFDGTSWAFSKRLSSGYKLFPFISCVAPARCVDAVGYQSATYDNGAWAPTQNVVSYANAVQLACADPTFCVALYSNGTYNVQRNGSWVGAQALSVAGPLSGLACPSASACIGIGEGVDYSFNGSTWAKTAATPDPRLTSISCTTATTCVAFDAAGDAGIVSFFDGSNWSTPMATGAGQLTAVSCITGNQCAATDAFGRAFVYDGTSWTNTRLLSAHGHLSDVSCSSSSFCAAVDALGNALTYNGSAWTAPLSVEDRSVRSVSCPQDGLCVAVDAAGRALTFDGHTWSAPTSTGLTTVLNSISCTSASFCVAVAMSGDAEVWDGVRWTTYPHVSSYSLTDVSCTSSSSCVAVSSQSGSVTFNGSLWAGPTAMGVGPTPSNRLSCSSATFCMGDSGVAYGLRNYDGQKWSSNSSAPYAVSGDVSCLPTRCVAVGTFGGVAEYDGYTWTRQTTFYSGAVTDGSLLDLTRVSCASVTFCVTINDLQAVVGSA